MKGMQGTLKVDLHTHTHYSPDSTMSPAELVARARAAGLDRLAVTDHNRMDGSFEAASIDPELVILAEEIDCDDGTDLIGLFLTEPVPKGLSIRETADRIRDQGGVVYLPHPYAYLRWPSRRAAAALEVTDVVEVFNARAFWPAWNRAARAAAAARGLAMAASSDGHFPHEIGAAYTELPAFADATGFRVAVAQARPNPARTQSPFIHIRSIATEAVRRTSWAFGAEPHYHGPRPNAREVATR
jgi:predicted metal-dependent phosphoesterase TrpH